MRSFLSNDPSFFYCPAQGCSSGQIHDTTFEGNIFRCNACGFRVCTHHTPHVPFHENETCVQFDKRIARERAEREEEERKRREEEAASLAEVENSSVECPGCGAHITKTAGCDHMTCKFLMDLQSTKCLLFQAVVQDVTTSSATCAVLLTEARKVSGEQEIPRMRMAAGIYHRDYQRIRARILFYSNL
jgi:predicted RNA-binding Zn-ribbon protein involved in translation (DUF1610 family)